MVLEFHDSDLLPSTRESRCLRHFAERRCTGSGIVGGSPGRPGDSALNRPRPIGPRPGHWRAEEWPGHRSRAQTLGMAWVMWLGVLEYAIRSRSSRSHASASKRRSASSWSQRCAPLLLLALGLGGSRRSVSSSSALFSSRVRARRCALLPRWCGCRPLSSECLERVQAFQHPFAQPLQALDERGWRRVKPRPAQDPDSEPRGIVPLLSEVRPPCKGFPRNGEVRDREDSGSSGFCGSLVTGLIAGWYSIAVMEQPHRGPVRLHNRDRRLMSRFWCRSSFSR